MAGFMILSKPVSSIIFRYGKMDEASVNAISMLLKFYSVGMLGLGLNEILSKAFFSLQDSRTPMRNSIISMVVNIVLAYILYNFMSTNGLALAAAFGSISNAALNWFCMTKKYPGMIKKSDIWDMVKCVISAVVMGIIVLIIYRFISPRFDGLIGNLITCAVCGIIGVAVYGLCVYITGVSDIRNFIKKKE